ncbi:hypothetical protein FHS00_001325 [Limimaricola variabilis]|uniref:Uncharacterized protein n=1 Tax=Limimaricola variabilis TaxID=1492771 RepID=A0ABR6HMH1_9RHOB|nr:hypothetical protein [Limimaricola variabilis]MBB3711754.1 hypothetical protein [Limimaricola variabilis]
MRESEGVFFDPKTGERFSASGENLTDPIMDGVNMKAAPVHWISGAGISRVDVGKLQLPVGARIVRSEDLKFISGEAKTFRDFTMRFSLEDQVDAVEAQKRSGILTKKLDMMLERGASFINTPENCNCHGGCGIEDCPGYGDTDESSYEEDVVSYEGARRRHSGTRTRRAPRQADLGQGGGSPGGEGS